VVDFPQMQGKNQGIEKIRVAWMAAPTPLASSTAERSAAGEGDRAKRGGGGTRDVHNEA
jgi:hypothetical protein